MKCITVSGLPEVIRQFGKSEVHLYTGRKKAQKAAGPFFNHFKQRKILIKKNNIY